MLAWSAEAWRADTATSTAPEEVVSPVGVGVGLFVVETPTTPAAAVSDEPTVDLSGSPEIRPYLGALQQWMENFEPSTGTRPTSAVSAEETVSHEVAAPVARPSASGRKRRPKELQPQPESPKNVEPSPATQPVSELDEVSFPLGSCAPDRACVIRALFEVDG